MYIPRHFAATDERLRELLAAPAAADLITVTADGLLATPLPMVHHPEVGERGALYGHVARNNDQWRRPAVGEALVIVRGPDGYITPSWYAAKAEHGRVVPTWDYVTAHVYGTLVVHDDPEWVRAMVTELTVRHESGREHPWAVHDAPDAYVEGQLRAIVGVELVIHRVEAKAKLSQNRQEADIDGVVAGLDESGRPDLAGEVTRARPPRRPA